LGCTRLVLHYLAHHELESISTHIIIMIMITTMIIITITFSKRLEHADACIPAEYCIHAADEVSSIAWLGGVKQASC